MPCQGKKSPMGDSLLPAATAGAGQNRPSSGRLRFPAREGTANKEGHKERPWRLRAWGRGAGGAGMGRAASTHGCSTRRPAQRLIRGYGHREVTVMPHSINGSPPCPPSPLEAAQGGPPAPHTDDDPQDRPQDTLAGPMGPPHRAGAHTGVVESRSTNNGGLRVSPMPRGSLRDPSPQAAPIAPSSRSPTTHSP